MKKSIFEFFINYEKTALQIFFLTQPVEEIVIFTINIKIGQFVRNLYGIFRCNVIIIANGHSTILSYQ